MNEFINILRREIGLLRKNPVYFICLIVLPVFVTVFFTSLMEEGQPQEMPVGVVDMDNTSYTRTLTRKLDEMQTAHVVAHYPNVSEARRAMQRDSIYAFMYFPKGTTDKLLSLRQPTISFYYSQTSLTAGALLFKDLKTVTTLGAAGLGQATMRAKGLTDKQITTILMPVALDVHNISNPWINYNVYLSTIMVPCCLMLLIMLLTTYTLGQEIKNNKGPELMAMAGGNIYKAVAGKLVIQTVICFLTMFLHCLFLFYVLGFPHHGGIPAIIGLSLLTVLSGQGFGILVFGLLPSMHLSMSVCSLWGVLSFSMVGTAFPVFAMDKPLEALSWLFPMRHYFVIYSQNIFNGLPLSDTFWHFSILLLIALSPFIIIHRIKTIFLEYSYME